MDFITFVLIAILPALFIIAMAKLRVSSPKSIENKHIVITGGSSGIGKSLALLAAKKGAHVTIVARDAVKLRETEKELEENKHYPEQSIQSVSLDVTDCDKVAHRFREIDDQNPIFMLVNCAGSTIAGTIEDTPVADARDVMNVNYFGTYYPIRAVVPRMKSRRKGVIVICGSQASLFGFFGYSVYASSKFALRGLAEVLDMEARPFNVSVTFALPPDTKTPGFDNDFDTKPEATRIISGAGGIYQPNVVAETIFKDALNRNFFSYLGANSFMLVNLCSGMSPSTVLEITYQCFILGYLKIIGSVYLRIFQNTVKSLNTIK